MAVWHTLMDRNMIEGFGGNYRWNPATLRTCIRRLDAYGGRDAGLRTGNSNFGYMLPLNNIVYLCFNQINPTHCELSNTILHEMLHRCGISNDENVLEYATYAISEWCLNSYDCARAPRNPCWK